MESVVMSFNLTGLASLSNIIFIERYSKLYQYNPMYYIDTQREKGRADKIVDKKRDQYSFTFGILRMTVVHAR